MHYRVRYYEEITVTGERSERGKALEWLEDKGYNMKSYRLQKGNKERFTLKGEKQLTDAVVLKGIGGR